MMLHTLADAREAVGRFVEAGSCDTAIIDQRINEALERLMDLQPWECLRRQIRFTVCGQCIALPYNVEKLLFLDTNGVPAKIFSQPYQFLSSGPGDLAYRTGGGSGFQDAVDLGGMHAVMYDLPRSYEYPADTCVTPSGWRLAAFSTSADDVGSAMTISGFNSTAHEIFTGSDRGEALAVQRWRGGTQGELLGRWGEALALSTNYFSDIHNVTKTETVGYVSLLAVDTTTNYISFLAKYHPKQVGNMQFRRYRITNKSCASMANVLALVQLRHVPLVDATDILPVTSLQALKLMVMAIREENASNLEGAANFMRLAEAVFAKREEAATLSGGTPTILNVCARTAPGRSMNRRGMIL